MIRTKSREHVGVPSCANFLCAHVRGIKLLVGAGGLMVVIKVSVVMCRCKTHAAYHLVLHASQPVLGRVQDSVSYSYVISHASC